MSKNVILIFALITLFMSCKESKNISTSEINKNFMLKSRLISYFKKHKDEGRFSHLVNYRTEIINRMSLDTYKSDTLIFYEKIFADVSVKYHCCIYTSEGSLFRAFTNDPDSYPEESIIPPVGSNSKDFRMYSLEEFSPFPIYECVINHVRKNDVDELLVKERKFILYQFDQRIVIAIRKGDDYVIDIYPIYSILKLCIRNKNE